MASPSVELSESLRTTPSQVNYAKLCRLVINGGTQVLRHVFDRIHRPDQLAACLSVPETEKTLKKLMPRVLKQNQWLMLYPTPATAVSSKHFDITLLNILFRNICNLSPPSETGWDDEPKHDDYSLAADIVRIKLSRNRIQHRNNTEINDNEFRRLWNDIRVVLVRHGADENHIDRLLNSNMNVGDTEANMKLFDEWKHSDIAMKGLLEDIGNQNREQLNMLHHIDVQTTKIARHIESGGVMVAPAEQRGRHTMPLEQIYKTQDPSLLMVADKCEKELRDIYRTTLSDVRPFPWSSAVHIEEIYTLPELQHKHGSKVTSFDRFNIFSERKVGRKYNPTRRVLIESDPGYGKSTFCLKFAYDWAMGDVEFVKDFKLVFLLKLQCFQEKIEDAIFETLLPEDCFIDKDQLWKYIRENQEHVVFLLDGWDEMTETATGDIRKILEGKMLRYCKVIVTSRKIRDDKAKQRVKSHFDLSLQLMGFSLESLKEYVCKHFEVTEQSDRVNVFIEQVNRSQVKGTLLKMMTCPLNSLLICDMWTATGSLTQNKTQLYQRIVDIIVKIYCENEGKVYETVRDSIDEQFVFLGELAFKSLLDSKFKIDKSELHLEKNSDILKMGFLTRYTADRQVVLAIDPMTSFLIHHRTFQEFFAAKYLASLRRDENTQKFRQTLRNFYSRMSKDCSPVLQFVAGFLKEACGDMFDVFCDSISRLDLIIECLKESTQPYSKSLLFTAAKATKDTCGVSGFDPDQHRNTQICVDLVEQWAKKDRKVSVFLRLGHPFHIKLYRSLLFAIHLRGGKLFLVIEFRNILKEQEISRKHHDHATDFTQLEIGSQHSAAPNSASDRGSTSVLTPDHIDSLFSQIEEVAVSNVQITCCSATSMAIYTALNKMKKLTSLNSVVIICSEPLLSNECISLEETFGKCLDVLKCNLRDNGVPYIYGVEGDEIRIEAFKQNLADNKAKESFFLRQCDPNPFLNAILKRGDLKDGNHDNVTSFEMTNYRTSYSDQIDMCKRLNSVFRIGCLQIDYPEGKIDLATFQAFVICVTAMASLQTLSMKGWIFQTDMHDPQIWIDLWGRLFVKLHHINLSSSLPSDRGTHDAETHPIIRGLCQAKESPECACVSVDLSDNILSEGDVVEMSRINVEVRRNNCDMSERSQHLLDIDDDFTVIDEDNDVLQGEGISACHI